MANMKYCLLFILAQYFQPSAFADSWNNHITSELEYLDTSGDFEHKGGVVEYRYQKKGEPYSDTDTYIGGQIRSDSINDEDRSYKGRSVTFIGATPVMQSTYLSGHLGINELTANTNRQTKQLARYTLYGRTALNDMFTIEAKHEHDLPYRQKIIETESGRLLEMTTSALDVSTKITDRLLVKGKLEHRSLSDGNKGSIQKAGVHYTISDSDPWASVGFETGRIDYDREDEGYWTPQNRHSHSVSLTSSIPLSDNLNISTFGSFGRSKDSAAGEYVTDSYLSTSAQYRSSDNLSLRAGINYGRSYGDDRFSETGAKFGFTLEHF